MSQEIPPSCLFCLEPVLENPISNPIGCSCRIEAHKSCFEGWVTTKQSLECPICHTVSIPNRLPDTQITIVYIDRTSTIQRRRHLQAKEQAAMFCCFLLLGWSIGVSVIEALLA